MTRTFLDIVPYQAGWLCRIDGVQQAVYNSYGLALAAAQELTLRERALGRLPVLRHQRADGCLEPVRHSGFAPAQTPLTLIPAG